MAITFNLHGKQVSGDKASVHFINWCLALENEHKPVARCSLDAIRDFQEAVFHDNAEKRTILNLAGITIQS